MNDRLLMRITGGAKGKKGPKGGAGAKQVVAKKEEVASTIKRKP